MAPTLESLGLLDAVAFAASAVAASERLAPLAPVTAPLSWRWASNSLALSMEASLWQGWMGWMANLLGRSYSSQTKRTSRGHRTETWPSIALVLTTLLRSLNLVPLSHALETKWTLHPAGVKDHSVPQESLVRGKIWRQVLWAQENMTQGPGQG
jgi:hypothetical protein